jgi:hypothetical protein
MAARPMAYARPPPGFPPGMPGLPPGMPPGFPGSLPPGMPPGYVPFTRIELMDRAPPPGFRPPPGFPGAMPFPPGQMPPGYVPHFASDFILMIDSPLVRLSDCVVVWKVGVDGVDPVECSSIRFVLHSWHLCSIHLGSSLVVACT